MRFQRECLIPKDHILLGHVGSTAVALGPRWFVLALREFNPIDPNPAISAHVVYPQSGHIRSEKGPFFQNFQHFSKLETSKEY